MVAEDIEKLTNLTREVTRVQRELRAAAIDYPSLDHAMNDVEPVLILAQEFVTGTTRRPEQEQVGPV
jgi:hypothetical protein